MKVKTTQKQKVMEFMKLNKTINTYQSNDIFKITRLSAVIFELNKIHEIKTIDRTINGTHYVDYYIHKEQGATNV